jgi:glutamate/tyrosine decarboxylase-like PLP-dependent enzyme
MLERESLQALVAALEKLDAGFASLPSFSPESPEPERLAGVLATVAARLQDNFPYFHPMYAGQMLKPPHPAARMAYALAMWINPNNHALDGGRASSAMEKEAVADIAKMFGWEKFLGHLCGGGTIANLEALWVAGQLHPGKKILASAQAHYTHNRISGVLQLKFESVACDTRGRLDVEALEKLAGAGDVGTVVATMGTTAMGAVDSLPRILELSTKYGFRVHADAAYGGYFTLAGNLADETAASFREIGRVDSIVIDPHKHGLQPYGCGCVLFRDPAVGKLYRHDSPYTYFSSNDLHLGEISLECSRPGAAAVALWATQQLLPLEKNGEFAQGLEQGRRAALLLHEKICSDERLMAAFAPELDIVLFAARSDSVSRISEKSREIFEICRRNNLHLALAEIPVKFFNEQLIGVKIDGETVRCLRSVMMKPEHEEWLERIWQVLEAAVSSIAESA